MSRAKPFQQVPYVTRHLERAVQREKNVAASQGLVAIEAAKKIAEEVGWTYSKVTGRARYSLKVSGGDTILHCIQKVSRLPWWRRLLVPVIGRYCEIGGTKYLKVGQTNIFYRAQEWVAGRAKKSMLRIVNV